MGRRDTMRAMVPAAPGAPPRVDTVPVPGIGPEHDGSRYVTLTEIRQTLDLLRQRRIRAIVRRTFPLEAAEAARELLRKNALVGRAALLQGGGGPSRVARYAMSAPCTNR